MAIRSFLRPSIVDFWVNDTMRTATRMRLESLEQIPPLTFWDYVIREPSIAMAIVFAMLCFFATFGCPSPARNGTLASPTNELEANDKRGSHFVALAMSNKQALEFTTSVPSIENFSDFCNKTDYVRH